MTDDAKKKLVLLGLDRTKSVREAAAYLRAKYPGAAINAVVFDRKKFEELEGEGNIDHLIFLEKSLSFLLTGARKVLAALKNETFDMLWVAAPYYPKNILIRRLIRYLGGQEQWFRSTDGRSWTLDEAKGFFPEPARYWFSRRKLRRKAIRAAYIIGEPLFPLLTFKSRKRPLDKAKIRKMLFLQMDLIGDVLLATPCLTVLRKNFPAATLDVMVSPWCRDLLIHNPYIDNILPYDARWFRDITPSRKKENMADLATDLLFRLRLFLRRYDIVFEPKGETSNVLLAYLTGAPYRIGYCFRHEPRTKLPPQDVRFLLSTDARYPMGEHLETHQVEHNLNVLRAAGLTVRDEDRELVLNVSPAEEEGVKKLLEEFGVRVGDLLIGIHPGASRKPKRWREDGFAAVADSLARKYGAKIIITGGSGDVALAKRISSLMESPAYIAAGQTSLLEFACLVGKMSLVITNETSANSISSAMKTPVVVLMTGVPELYGPYRVPHAAIVNKLPCRNIEIEHCSICPYDEYKCLQEITPGEVVKAAESLLEKGPAHKAEKAR